MKTKEGETVAIEMSKEEAAALALVIRMSGYHRMKEYPNHLKRTENHLMKMMSRILKRLEKATKN